MRPHYSIALALAALVVAPAAEARTRTADLAVERVRATSSGAVSFTVVNRGERRSRGATVRVAVGAAAASVKQSSLRPRSRVRRTVRVTGLQPGTWRARVCVRPRAERVRGNDCGSAARALTVPAPAFTAPVPQTAAEVIAGPAPSTVALPAATATPVSTPVATPATTATATPVSTPVATPATTATASPVVTATAAASPTATATVTATATPIPTATPTPTATATATATPTATTTPTATATATATPTATATVVSSPSPSAPGDVATSYQQNPRHDGFVTGTAPAPPLASVWTKDLDSSPSAPVMADGRIFVVTIHGVLHALDQRNGATLWKKGIGTRGGTVAYDGGRVYATDEDSFLIAVDAASGLTLWTDYLQKPTEPVAQDGRVYGPGGLVFDGATGKRLQATSPYPPQPATPTLDGDRIYYACQGAAALSRATSAFAWKTQANLNCPGELAGRPATLHAGRLYATESRDGSFTGAAAVYDADTGAELATFARRSSPAFGNGLGLFLENGVLQARDATSYAARWSFAGASGTLKVPPLIANGLVYVNDHLQLHVLDLQTGAVRWSGSTGATTGVMKGMAIAQGTLVLSTSTGIAALRSASAPARPGPADATPAPVDLGPPAPLPGASTNPHVNAAHTAAINLSDPAPPLERRWRIWIDARQAIVADGRLFAIGPVAARLDPDTGATLWSYPGGAERAAYDRGRLFLGTKTEGLVALDAETGAKLWSNPTGSTAPVAVDGELYGGGGDLVVRYDPATGAQLWRHLGDDYVNSRNRRTPSVEGQYVYPGGLCAVLSRATGLVVKQLEGCPDSEHPFAPVAAGHMFESGLGQSGLNDIDVERGFRVNRLGSVAPPAVIGNLAITSGSSVKAYEFPSWTPRWKYAERDPQSMAVPPLIVGRHVYFAYAEGFLRAVDVDTGRVVWSDLLGENLTHYTDQVGTAIAVGDGLLVVPTGSRMTAYRSAPK